MSASAAELRLRGRISSSGPNLDFRGQISASGPNLGFRGRISSSVPNVVFGRISAGPNFVFKFRLRISSSPPEKGTQFPGSMHMLLYS